MNVLIGKNGVAKLADQSLLNPGQTGYVKTLIRADFAYLSPKLMEELRRQARDPLHNHYKSDVWSLGLTLLEAATLISSRTVYDWETETISFSALHELLARVESRYSRAFHSVLL